MKIERVLERVYDRGRLHRAWQAVKSNAGAAGIDHVTVEAFGERAEEHLARIHEKLRAGTKSRDPEAGVNEEATVRDSGGHGADR